VGIPQEIEVHQRAGELERQAGLLDITHHQSICCHFSDRVSHNHPVLPCLPSLLQHRCITHSVTFPRKRHTSFLERESELQAQHFPLPGSAKMQTPLGKENGAAGSCLCGMVCFYSSLALPKISGSINYSIQTQTCPPITSYRQLACAKFPDTWLSSGAALQSSLRDGFAQQQ
jgi:hypothetical protein